MQLLKHRFVDDWYPVSHSVSIDYTCRLGCVFCPATWEESASQIEYPKNPLDFEENKWNVFNQFVGLGGGLYELADIHRIHKNWLDKCLNYLLKNNNKILLQTRSTAIIEILKKIDEEQRKNILVIMGFFSIDNQIASRFEPNIAPPIERLKTLKKLRSMGFFVGANLMPLLPEQNEQKELIKMTFKLFKEYTASFALYQKADKETQEQVYIRNGIPLYRESKNKLDEDVFFKQMSEFYRNANLLPRIPFAFFYNHLEERQRVVVSLRYLYYYHLFLGKSRDAYKISAHHIARLKEEQWSFFKSEDKLLKIPGVGGQVEKIVRDFLRGNWNFLDKLETDMTTGS